MSGNVLDTPGLEFSLIRGGPWYKLQRHLRLFPSGEWPGVHRRIVVILCLTWVPVIILTLGEQFLGRVDADLSILGRYGMHARFLLAMPLFIAAEPLFERGFSVVLRHLVHGGLVPTDGQMGFHTALAQVARIRDSWLVFFIILVAVLASSWGWFFAGGRIEQVNWTVGVQGDALSYGLGGLWYLALATPLVDLYLVLWFLRIALVWILMWRIARLDLEYVPGHPDGRAGTGFLESVPLLFLPFMMGVSCILAGELAHEILSKRESFSGAIELIVAYVAFVAIALVGPLLFFSGSLVRIRLVASVDYSRLLYRYNRAVHRRWIDGQNVSEDPLLNAPEIGPSVDAGALFERVYGIVPIPFRIQTVVVIVICTALPFLPVAALEIPVWSLLGRIVGTIF